MIQRLFESAGEIVVPLYRLTALQLAMHQCDSGRYSTNDADNFPGSFVKKPTKRAATLEITAITFSPEVQLLQRRSKNR